MRRVHHSERSRRIEVHVQISRSDSQICYPYFVAADMPMNALIFVLPNILGEFAEESSQAIVTLTITVVCPGFAAAEIEESS